MNVYLEWTMLKPDIHAGLTEPGEYAPAGEAQGELSSFSAQQLDSAFSVDVTSVQRAMAAELGLGNAEPVDSRQAHNNSLNCSSSGCPG
jgi:hypothetical protein